MNEHFTIEDLKTGNRLEQWAAIEIEQLRATVDRLRSITQMDWRLSGTAMTYYNWLAVRGEIAEKASTR